MTPESLRRSGAPRKIPRARHAELDDPTSPYQEYAPPAAGVGPRSASLRRQGRREFGSGFAIVTACVAVAIGVEIALRGAQTPYTLIALGPIFAGSARMATGTKKLRAARFMVRPNLAGGAGPGSPAYHAAFAEREFRRHRRNNRIAGVISGSIGLLFAAVIVAVGQVGAGIVAGLVSLAMGAAIALRSP